MKKIAFVAALLIGSAAVGQTMSTPPATEPMPAPPTTTEPVPPTESTPSAAMPGQASTGQNPTPDGMSAAQPSPTANSYPRCSRTVVDQCIQSSSRESDMKGGMPAHRKHRRH